MAYTALSLLPYLAPGGFEELLNALGDPNEFVRLEARQGVYVHVAYGETKQTRRVANLLASGSPTTQASAAWILGSLHEHGVDYVDELRNAMGSPDNSVREEAARALGKIQGPARKAIPALLHLAEHDSSTMVVGAAREVLDELEPWTHIALARRWGARGDHRKALDLLVTELAKAESAEVVNEVIDGLADQGSRAIPFLLRAAGPARRLGASSPVARLQSFSRSKEYVPALMRSLAGTDPDAQACVISLLAGRRDLAKDLRSRLASLAAGENVEVSCLARWALERLDGKGSEVSPCHEPD